MASLSSQQVKLVVGLAAATLGVALLYYALRPSRTSTRARGKRLDDDDDDDDDEDDDDNNNKDNDGTDEATIRASNRSTAEQQQQQQGGGSGKSAPYDGSSSLKSDGKSSLPTSMEAATVTATAAADAAAAAALAELHSKIEEIDKRGKALFKSKSYMEAASAFTEALDLIDAAETFAGSGGNNDDDDNNNNNDGGTKSSPSPPTSGSGGNNLARQVITLTNNRSAMYEKAQLPDLALLDCDTILEKDPFHSKARARRLRILESEKRHGDALVEVCAIQLRFMRDNRDKLRMGLPLSPPVPQSKIEDLMEHLVPAEIERCLNKIRDDNKERALPSAHTIVQLLKSFSGYNSWMGDAARGGSVRAITEELNEADRTARGLAVDAGDDVAVPSTEINARAKTTAKRVRLLLKRGKRHAYDRNFASAKDDFESAFALAESGGESVIAALGEKADGGSGSNSDDTYARLLEWTAMSRHLRYDLPGALRLYERCSELEPTNPTLLVKRAGVCMDNNKHDDASRLFDEALTLDPDAPDALLHRANLGMLRSKPDDALTDLKRCLALRPDNVLARLRLATVRMALGDLDGAGVELDEAERLDPQSSEVHSYRGEMHFAKGDLAEAKAEFDRAIECDPNNPTPYVNAALCVMNSPGTGGGAAAAAATATTTAGTLGGGLPDIPEAMRLLKKAIDVDPQFHAAYVHLGQLMLSTATDLVSANEVVRLYDCGLEHCRTAEELKDIVTMRILTVAQIDAARSLKMETLNMQ